MASRARSSCVMQAICPEDSREPAGPRRGATTDAAKSEASSIPNAPGVVPGSSGSVAASLMLSPDPEHRGERFLRQRNLVQSRHEDTGGFRMLDA